MGYRGSVLLTCGGNRNTGTRFTGVQAATYSNHIV